MKRTSMVIRTALVASLLAVTLGFFAARETTSTLADGVHPGITPALVDETILAGDSLDIEKTVHTPEIPPQPDICFLADSTGSMGDALANVQANAATIMNAVLAVQPDAEFCAAQYRDSGDTPEYSLDQAVTANTVDVQNAINGWTAGGGGDVQEGQLHALTLLAGAATGWRPSPATHIIVWFGDSSGHDPSIGGETLASTIDALTTTGAGAPIRVVALPVVTDLGDGLDATGQATAIADATGGLVLPGASPDQVAAAILEGLTNLPVEVSMATDCSDPISVSFAPASQIVTSGEDAVFTETISVADDATQDQTYECDDWALVNGVPMADEAGNVIHEHKTIYVPDVVPPVAACFETVNPHGATVPPAGSTTLPGPKGGQNEDGFYELAASDNVDPNPQIFVEDTGSGTVFGPFTSGTIIKYTEDPTAVPTIKPIGSTNGQADAVDWHIIGNGDPSVFAVDASGNVSDPAYCLVPPPPK